MRALAGIHRVAWREKCAYLGDPVPFVEDVERWDRFLPKLAEPDRFALLERWSSQAALDQHAKLNSTRPPMAGQLRAGPGEREDYVYNRTR
jgi:quinol monooxygenase YgiN